MWYLPKDYNPVHERVQEFHEKFPKGSITSTYELLDGDTVVFQATLSIEDRMFTGTSFWSIKKDKALEKLETVAVWRALAFAGFGTTKWIASREEMEKFEDSQEDIDDKIWINDHTITQMMQALKKWKIKAETLPELMKQVYTKYKVSKENQEKIKKLFVSFKTQTMQASVEKK